MSGDSRSVPFQMSKIKGSQESTQPIEQSSNENAAVSRTVNASFNFGQFLVNMSREVSSEVYAKLANEGFKSIGQAASSKLDSHKEFGNFGHKDASGKIVERGSYKRGQIAYTPEREEIVRQFVATNTLPSDTVTVTVSRYIPSTVKTVSVDQAGLIVAKNAIVKRGDNPTELDKLAKMVSFDYSATSELTVDNAAFVEKVASFYANL